jgi:hypothetical protein
MADTRELILVRLLAICVAQGGFVTKIRNRGLLETDKRPAAVLFDGDEAPVLTHGGRSNRARNGILMGITPQIMVMRPELFITLAEPTNSKEALEALGTALNAKRIQLIRAIGEDDELLLLLGANGGLLYNGCATDLKSGSTFKGQMRLDFEYRYTLFPTTDQQGAS